MELNMNIKTLRRQKGVTQEALAEAMGVSFQAVSKWEQGATSPDVSLLPQLAVYFGVSIDELFHLPVEKELERIENAIDAARAFSPDQLVDLERRLKALQSEKAHQAEVHALLGRLYLRGAEGYAQQAREQAKLALQIKPDLHDAHYVLVTCMGGATSDGYVNRHYALIRFYQEHVACNPATIEGRLWLLAQLIHDGRATDAEEALAALEKLVPNHVLIRFIHGDIAWLRGDREAAMAQWQDGITQYEGKPWQGYFAYADRMERIGDYQKAIAYYQMDLDQAEPPRYVDSAEAITNLYECLGEYDKAIEAQKTCIRICKEEWHIVSGETIDLHKRRIAELEKQAKK